MTSSPHTAAGPFAAAPSYEREVVQMATGLRRALRIFGVLLAFVLPAVSMHFDPYGFDVTCHGERRECVIVEHHFARAVTTTVAFNAIEVVQTHTEWSNNDGDRFQTGRFTMTFNLLDGRKIDASLSAYPEQLRADALRAYVKAPNAPTFTMTTSTTLADQSGILVFFLFGLLIFAVTLWRTEVCFDPATSTLRVNRQLWPLLRRTVFQGPVSAVKNVRTDHGEICSVMMTLQDRRQLRVARTVTSVSADAITAAIRRPLRSRS